MTVRRGQPWGAAAGLPDGAPVAASNAELRRLVARQRAGAEATMPIGVVGGDLWRVVGAPTGGAERLRSEHARTAPIDLIEATVDGETHWACVGIVARNSWWRGAVLAAMNAESLGAWRLAPAAHPNDGKLHVISTGLDRDGHGQHCPAPTGRVSGGLSVTQRLLARSRLRTGAHLPHPGIAVRRTEQVQFRFGRPLGLWLDGERVGRCAELTLAIRPDAATIVF